MILIKLNCNLRSFQNNITSSVLFIFYWIWYSSVLREGVCDDVWLSIMKSIFHRMTLWFQRSTNRLFLIHTQIWKKKNSKVPLPAGCHCRSASTWMKPAGQSCEFFPSETMTKLRRNSWNSSRKHGRRSRLRAKKVKQHCVLRGPNRWKLIVLLIKPKTNHYYNAIITVLSLLKIIVFSYCTFIFCK